MWCPMCQIPRIAPCNLQTAFGGSRRSVDFARRAGIGIGNVVLDDQLAKAQNQRDVPKKQNENERSKINLLRLQPLDREA